jgi:hypothetical protein
MPVKPVTCNGCGERFRPKLVARPTADGGEGWQYCCPYCQRWYTAGSVSARGVKIRQELQVVEEALLLKPGNESLIKKLKDLQQAMLAEVSSPSRRKVAAAADD